MILLLGWLLLVLPLLWLTGFSFFATIPTFGEALFTGNLLEKALGVALWCFTVFCWYSWLTSVNLTIN